MRLGPTYWRNDSRLRSVTRANNSCDTMLNRSPGTRSWRKVERGVPGTGGLFLSLGDCKLGALTLGLREGG